MLNTTKATTKAVAKNTKPLTAKQIATQASKTATVAIVAPVLQVPVAATIAHSAFTQFVKEAEKAVVEVIQENIQTSFEAELVALQAKHGVTATVKYASPKAPKAPKIAQNGITRPTLDSICGLIWSICDNVSTDTSPAQISIVRADVALKLINDHTIKTQYARWRKFNGVTGYTARTVATQVQGEDLGLVAL